MGAQRNTNHVPQPVPQPVPCVEQQFYVKPETTDVDLAMPGKLGPARSLAPSVRFDTRDEAGGVIFQTDGVVNDAAVGPSLSAWKGLVGVAWDSKAAKAATDHLTQATHPGEGRRGFANIMIGVRFAPTVFTRRVACLGRALHHEPRCAGGPS